MNTRSSQPLRLGSPADVLAVVPPLLGFTPINSLVILGATPPRDRIQVAFRYDLPDPPDNASATEIAEHAGGVLSRNQLAAAVVIGYGPGRLVTPLADAIREMAASRDLKLHDVLRAEDCRYWSYLCSEPSCCPAEGVVYDVAAHPTTAALATTGLAALPSREELAATLAPATGPAVEVMRAKTRKAESTASRRINRDGRAGLHAAGRAAVQAAIARYRTGGGQLSAWQHAWLSVMLTELPVRDDAWARMDPGYGGAHQRLWTDQVRHAQPGYAAAPASLLAFTAWQGGNGALANIAIDRALEDTPGYSMALLLREALDAGIPPSAAVLPMTPEEVAASYARHYTSAD